MTDFVQTEGTEKKLIPFLKLGAFDESNYPPKKAAEIKANEVKYGTIRLNAGDNVCGEVTGIFGNANGQVMYLKDVTINDKEVGRVKVPLTTALTSLIVTKLEKVAGEKVAIVYKGLKSSKANPGKTYHDVTVV